MSMFKRNAIVGIMALFIVQIFSGCAIIPSKITLLNTEYSDHTSASKKGISVCLQKFKDKADSNVVGHQQNNYGAKMANIIATNNVTDWVMEGIKRRLQNEGYTVETTCGNNSDAITLNGAVIRVYTTAYNVYQGEVVVEVEASRFESKLFTTQFTGYKKQGDFWSTSKNASVKILGQALDSFIEQLVDKMNQAGSASTEPVDDNEKYLPQITEPVNSENLPNRAAQSESYQNDVSQCTMISTGFSILSGNRSRSSINDGLSNIGPSIRPIYRDQYELHPGLDGSVCLRLSITPWGEVGNVFLLQSTLNSPLVENALIDIVKKTKFETTRKSTENTVIVYSKKFAGESVKSSRVGIGLLITLLISLPSIILISSSASK